MDKDILNDVIEAEREIQRCVEEEQARLRAWIDQVKRESAEAVARAEQNDGEELVRAVEAARRQAEAAAKQVVAAAEARAERFQNLQDGALTAVVMKRLPRILLE